MRILQLSNKAPYPPNDGSSIAIYNMANGFIQNNVELHLLSINTKKHYKADNEIPASFKKSSNYLSIYRDTNISLLGLIFNLFSSASYFVSRFFFKEFEKAIETKLKENQFDIIQLEGIFLGNYLPIIRKYSKGKIILRAHNIEHLIWERLLENEKNFFKKIYLKIQNQRLKKFEIDIFKSVDAIVTITPFDESFIRKIPVNTKTFVSATGIDLERYKIEKQNEIKGSVFHFGSMDWMPNLEAVNWFLEKIWEPNFIERKDLQLIFAGRFMPKQLKEKEGANIKVLEDVKDNIEFYNNHEIMLVPLLSGSGMRIKIIEGMAMGKCIISTSIGAEGIPVSDKENIILANTEEEMKMALNEVINNPELRKTIGANARKFIEREFDNKEKIKSLIEFYRNI